MLLLLYVDDIVLTGNTSFIMNKFIHHLRQSFTIKDIGKLQFFLGIKVHYTSHGLFLTQSKYAREQLQRANMSDCNSIATPMMVHIAIPQENAFSDPQLYHSIASALQYLTFMHPNLAYYVNHLCQFMHAPSNTHFHELKRVLWYVKGTIDLGFNLYTFAYANWARCPLNLAIYHRILHLS